MQVDGRIATKGGDTPDERAVGDYVAELRRQRGVEIPEI